MNDEILETLLLDHALGELSPEVVALLGAHLALDPAANRRAAELAETLRLTRAAVATPLAPPSRKLDLERVRQAQRHAWSSARRTEVLRLAACLLLGLGVGWSVRTLSTTADFVAPPIAVAPMRSAKPEPSVHFWSVARFAPAVMNQENSRRLRWNSTAPVPPNPSLQ
jgi:anti-sigma factor RsiW